MFTFLFGSCNREHLFLVNNFVTNLDYFSYVFNIMLIIMKAKSL